MRLLRAGVPEERAPSALLPHLQCFMEVWEGLRLDEATPYEDLLSHVQTWGVPFALELLARRPTLAEDVAELLSSRILARRRIGARLVGRLKLATPDILTALTRWLDQSDSDAGDLHTALDTAVYLERKAAPLRPALERLAIRIGKADYYLQKRVLDVAERVAPKKRRK